MESYRSYWQNQQSSGQRYTTPEFLVRKASEHAQMIKSREGDDCESIIDLGCGAGELLQHLVGLLNVAEAIDYSESMLNSAKRLMNGSRVVFRAGDVFEILPGVRFKVWMTAEALNQYLGPDEITEILRIFRDNVNARSFYLFDCVDPIRYLALGLGSYYYLRAPIKGGPISRTLRRYKACIATAVRLVAFSIRNEHWRRWHSVGMGVAYTPKFWLEVGRELGLGSIEFESSKFYEYRYHVIIRKRAGQP